MARRVALYTDASGFGGAEVQLVSLAERLDRSRFCPVVMYSPTPGVAPMLERLAAPGLEAVPVPPMEGIHHLGRVGRLAAVLRRNQVDIFHAHKPHPAAGRYGLLAAVLAGCRGIFSTDQLRPPVVPSRRQVLLLRVLSARMHGHIAVSRSVKNYLVEILKFRAEKVRVIPNWVDPVIFQGMERSEKRKELGVSDGTVVLGLVARFHKQKGHEDLVRAARDLAQVHPKMLFVLIGDGPTRPAVQAQVQALGLAPHFIFLGQRHDVPAFLAAFDIFVLPSHYEGLPISILEAMAAGTPVVATAVDGTAEVIEDGVCGILVPPRNVVALREALDRLIRHPELRASLGSAGRARVMENFSAGPLVRETEALYGASL